MRVAFDRLGLGIVVLDRRRRIIVANALAAAILDQRQGLLARGGHLRCSSSRDAARLDVAIERARHSEHKQSEHKRPGGSQVLRIERAAAQALQVLALSAAGRETADPASKRAAVVLIIADPPRAAPPRADWIAHLLHLTAAEARLSAALGARHTLASYAAETGITIGTARWTLKRVLAKTGCRRQSELVHLIATSVAGLFGDRPRGQKIDSPSHLGGDSKVRDG